MLDLYRLARPVLFTIEPEKAHHLTLRAMRCGAAPSCGSVRDARLEQTIWGLKFPNPVGLSAGFDKNAEVIGPAFRMGFGFVEAGTVTPKPQSGNPQPRVFRDPANHAVINRMGFPNAGMNVFKDNVAAFLARKPKPDGVLGINIGMNKTQTDPAKDYRALIKMLGPMADYLTINISSPNTPGLRDLQSREPLLALLSAVREERAQSCADPLPPLLLKLAPDLDDAQIEELAQAAIDGGVDGLILTNTTLDRPTRLDQTFAQEKGGLSGQPLTQKSTEVIRKFYAATQGKLPIIGVGGVETAAQAYAKIKAGASLVQVYTGLIYRGPRIAAQINAGLLDLLAQDGFSYIRDAIGAEHR
ncbi:MAG: quinone-dependent dihydroorotate dehydrogenase [Bdellovibrionales bacterium]